MIGRTWRARTVMFATNGCAWSVEQGPGTSLTHDWSPAPATAVHAGRSVESRPMIQAQQELLAALAQALEQTVPGHGLVPAFESPKQAAHGDLAITAAMPLARLAKSNPRDLANMFQTIQRQGGGGGGGFLSDHPSPSDRYARINREAQMLRVEGGMGDSREFAARESHAQKRRMCVLSRGTGPLSCSSRPRRGASAPSRGASSG